jgi:hypothetical protein
MQQPQAIAKAKAVMGERGTAGQSAHAVPIHGAGGGGVLAARMLPVAGARERPNLVRDCIHA